MNRPNSCPTYIHYPTKHTRPPTIYIYSYNTAVHHPIPCNPPMTNNHQPRPKAPTLRSPSPPSPTRHPHCTHPRTSNYRNNQPPHSTLSPGNSTRRKSYCRPPFNTTNRNSRLYPTSLSPPPRCPDRPSPNSSHTPRNCSCINSTLRICTPPYPIPRRKHLMTHQAHPYHIVDPSPWPLSGAIAALLITSGLAV